MEKLKVLLVVLAITAVMSADAVRASPIYFSAQDHDYQYYLYSYEGGSLSKVSGPVSPGSMTVAGGELFFSAYDSANTYGNEPWKPSGMIADVNPGANSSYPTGFTAYNGGVYYGADDGSGITKLFSTAKSPVQVNSYSSTVANLAVLGSTLYFNAASSYGTGQLYTYNGSTVAAEPGWTGFTGNYLTSYNNKLYYVDDGLQRLYYAYPVYNEYYGQDVLTNGRVDEWLKSVTNLVVSDNKLFFTATNSSWETKLYSWDGAATAVVTDFYPSSYKVDGAALYIGNGSDGSVWVYNGVNPPTLFTSNPYAGSGEFTVSGGSVIYGGYDSGTSSYALFADSGGTATVLASGFENSPLSLTSGVVLPSGEGGGDVPEPSTLLLLLPFITFGLKKCKDKKA